MKRERLGLPDERWLVPALVLNSHPAAYVHPSWLESVPHHEIVGSLLREPSAMPALSRYLAETLELDGSYCDDFSSPFSRLALLDGAAAAELSLYVGLALRSAELRSQLVGSEVRAVREALGSRAYDFAVRTTPLLGRIPEFSFEPADELAVLAPVTRFSLVGARYIWSGLRPRPPQALVRRALLKLPSSWEAHLATAWDGDDNEDETAAGILPPLVYKVLKEVLPSWRPLFD